MSEQTKKLDVAEIEKIVRRLVEVEQGFVSLSEDDKSRVTLGTSIKNDIARCMAYVPGERPELGKIIAVYDVNRSTGVASSVPESEW